MTVAVYDRGCVEFDRERQLLSGSSEVQPMDVFHVSNQREGANNGFTQRSAPSAV